MTTKQTALTPQQTLNNLIQALDTALVTQTEETLHGFIAGLLAGHKANNPETTNKANN